MKEKKSIRLLTKDDIEVRVAQTDVYQNRDGSKTVKVTLLLYKNARIDMKILDELYGPLGWKRSHKMIGDRLYCEVSVYDPELQQWVSKEDVGVESNTSPEKGQASDAFKRACFNWGIGRELYSSPRVSIRLNDSDYSIDDKTGRLRVRQSFCVSDIAYDEAERTITHLAIEDNDGTLRWNDGPVYGRPAPAPAPAPAVATPISEEIYKGLNEISDPKAIRPYYMSNRQYFDKTSREAFKTACELRSNALKEMQ